MRAKQWSRGLVVLLVLAMLFTMTAANLSASSADRGNNKVDVLIGFQGLPNPGLVRAFGGEIYAEFTLVDVIAARITEQQARALNNHPAISYIEPDGIVYAINQTVPWGIERVFNDDINSRNITWNESTGFEVSVFVLDTGIDRYHEDLTVVGGRRFYTQGPFLRSDDRYDDGHGHGTHVAGTIGALNNSIGVVGVAPAVDLFAVKVLTDNGSGSVSAIIAGIEWTVAQGKENSIINMSLGSSSYNQSFEDACQAAFDAGLLVVASAGNSGNSGGTGDNVGYPAKYESVIAVAASDSDDQRASFSSTGPAVELIAPGVSVLSTLPGNKYGSYSGTSMASPHVAGVAALVWAADSTMNNIKLRGILNETAQSLGLHSYHQGNGLVRADLAVAEALRTGPEPPMTGSITGTVKDTSDSPIGGALVQVEGTDLTTTTNASGIYLLENVPEGTHDVRASAEGYISATLPAPVEAGDSFTLNFNLTSEVFPTYIVSGTVKDSDGNLLEGAKVTIEGASYAITDSNGEYSILGIDGGTYSITASKAGYISQTITEETIENDTTLNFTLVKDQEELECPKIEDWDLQNNSNPAWTRVIVNWKVSGNDLAIVTTVMKNTEGVEVASQTSSINGNEASGTHELRIRGHISGLYYITLTVTDKEGKFADDIKEISL